MRPLLETNPSGELQLALRIQSRRDDSRCRLAERRVWRAELRRIEEIEGVGPYFEAGIFNHRDRPRQAEIDIMKAWSPEDVAPGVAKGVFGGSGKGCRIEPMIDGSLAFRQVPVGDSVRVFGGSGIAVVRALHRCEGHTGLCGEDAVQQPPSGDGVSDPGIGEECFVSAKGKLIESADREPVPDVEHGTSPFRREVKGVLGNRGGVLFEGPIVDRMAVGV